MTAYELTIYGLTMGSAGCAAAAAYPAVSKVWLRLAERIGFYQQAKVERTARTLGRLFLDMQPRWLTLLYWLGPIGTGAAALILVNNLWVTVAAAVLGLLAPDVLVRQARALRRRRFQEQLLDALFILSSSLRAGLSFVQALESLEAEMPPPASQEFGLVMRAHRLGQTLEEALQGLNQRMASEELNLIVTAILVARETGGDITHIISQLIETIRERKKLYEKVKTLTMLGKLQGYLMSLLPVGFALFVRTVTPNYFEILLEDATGQGLLVLAAALWVVGIVLLFRLSRVEV